MFVRVYSLLTSIYHNTTRKKLLLTTSQSQFIKFFLEGKFINLHFNRTIE